jgi:hypothetical protein
MLSSGAISQYPAPLTTGQAAQVIRFLDGSDQRYLTQSKMLRSWEIQLDLLNEAEIQQIEAFFISQQGDYLSFVFPDPFTGSMVPNCRFGAPGLLSTYVAVDASSTSLWVIETHG